LFKFSSYKFKKKSNEFGTTKKMQMELHYLIINSLLF